MNIVEAEIKKKEGGKENFLWKRFFHTFVADFLWCNRLQFVLFGIVATNTVAVAAAAIAAFSNCYEC